MQYTFFISGALPVGTELLGIFQLATESTDAIGDAVGKGAFVRELKTSLFNCSTHAESACALGS